MRMPLSIVSHLSKLSLIAVIALAAGAPVHAAEISGELIAKARQEGQVIYYTDLIVDQIVRPLASAFEAKYAIKVSFTRADSQVNILKLLNEHQAGRVMSDIFGLNTGLESSLRRAPRGNSPPRTARSCRRATGTPTIIGSPPISSS